MLGLDALTGRGRSPSAALDWMAPSVETLQAFGALSPRRLLECGRVWLLVTPIFLHLGLLHFLFNTIALWQLGPLAEEAFGKARFLVLYVGAGIAGNAVSVLFGVGGAGASGAIFGLMGATLVFARRRRRSIGPALVYRWLMQWLFYAVLLSLFVRNINHYAHGGGFVAGALLGLLADRVRRNASWRLGARAAAAAVVVSFAFAASDAPKILRGVAVLTFSREVGRARGLVFDLAGADGGSAESAAALRDAVAKLRGLTGLGREAEIFRREAVEALEMLLAPGDGSAQREALVSFGNVVRRLDAWLLENACAHGLSMEPDPKPP